MAARQPRLPTRADQALAAGLLDDARDGLLALDENGIIVAANQAAADRLDRARDQLTGEPFAAFVQLSERRELRRALLHLEPDEPARVDVHLGEPATLFTLVLRVVPQTAPRVVFATLLAGRGDFQLETFLLRFHQAVVGVRRDHKVAFANERAHALLGSDAVRVGRPPAADRLGIDLPPIIERLLSVPAPLAPTEIETEGNRTIRITGLGPAGDEPAVIFFEDVTAQHRRERPMREFVRNAAHQLRTPLTGIATAVEVLEGGAKNDPAARDRFLAHIRQHTDRLIRLSRGLLVLAQAQSGEPPRLDLVELRPLLEALADSAKPAAGVTIVTECSPELTALAERDLLHEALAALVDNAVKYTRQGEVRLTARDGDGNVTIAVVDSGPGILPEHLPRILEPFYRTAADGQNFGLGLAIAAQAVAAMNGELTTAASPSGGTTFAISLPSGRIAR